MEKHAKNRNESMLQAKQPTCDCCQDLPEARKMPRRDFLTAAGGAVPGASALGGLVPVSGRLAPTDPHGGLRKAGERAKRGKLKICFGMCPGVGKTFAMLQAAREKQSDGCEVVIGIVETHGRKETEALLEGMPIMPRSQVE